MFCSSCGRTLLAGDTQCKHCGTPVGESVFVGIPYTSAQRKLLPGEEPQAGVRAYTHISYAEPEEEQAVEADREAPVEAAERPAEDGLAPEPAPEADEPVAALEDVAAPEDTDAPEAAAESAETPEAASASAAEEPAPIAEDISDLKARPIASKGQSGISADVSEYMQKLESGKGRRARKKAKEEQLPAETKPEEEAQARKPVSAPVYGDDEEDFEEEIDERPALSGRAVQAIKVAVLLALLAAIVVGAIFWVRHVRESAKSAPIDGVTVELYDSGLETITQHADTTYVRGLLDLYNSDGILTLTQRLESDAAEITALTPAEASVADSQFISALRSIQTNINNAVTMDALAIAQPTEGTVADSNARWQVINASIAQLKAATSTQQLEAIINGERIQIQTAAPTATPAPVQYNTLTRGDKNEEVRLMQERLWQLGFLQDVRDGNFGGNTYTAVKTFQQAAGLDVTGIADARTLTALFADDAPTTQYAQTGAATATPSPTPAVLEAPEPATGN